MHTSERGPRSTGTWHKTSWRRNLTSEWDIFSTEDVSERMSLLLLREPRLHACQSRTTRGRMSTAGLKMSPERNDRCLRRGGLSSARGHQSFTVVL